MINRILVLNELIWCIFGLYRGVAESLDVCSTDFTRCEHRGKPAIYGSIPGLALYRVPAARTRVRFLF